MRIILLVPLLLLTGCDAWFGTYCTAEAVPALEVEVRDAETDAFVAGGATAVARDGAYADALIAHGATGDGTITTLGGAYERPGTYVVTVEHPDYRTWQRAGVRVREDECHVETIRLRADLQPN